MTTLATMNRRQFLGTTTSGLTLGFSLNTFGPMSDAQAAVAPATVNTWLSVGTDSSITLTVGASDMGQGSFQGLGQVLAEDLMVDPARVTLVQGGPTLVSPAPVGSAISTVGSSVTRNNYWRLRDASAIARQLGFDARFNDRWQILIQPIFQHRLQQLADHAFNGLVWRVRDAQGTSQARH